MSDEKNHFMNIAKDAWEYVDGKSKEIVNQSIKAVDKMTEEELLFIKKTQKDIEDKIKDIQYINKREFLVYKFAGTKIEVLLPDGYEKIKEKQLSSEIKSISKNIVASFQKKTEMSNNQLIMLKPKRKKNDDEKEMLEMIEKTRANLLNNQGLVEIDKGKTPRGLNFFYSLIKTISEDGMDRISYNLHIILDNNSQEAEIYGQYSEIGDIGIRESEILDLANRYGKISVEDGRLNGWNRDPYSNDYVQGQLMNLSERPGVDAFFPESALSQARELVLSITRDEFVSDFTQGVSVGGEIESLFGWKDFRNTYLVNVNRPKESK